MMGRVCATRGCSVATVTSADLSLCWLKKQKGSLAPEQIDAEGETVSWTSGLIFGKGEGIVGQETEFGTLRVKWRTVFGSVLPEDMHIADKISILPTKSDVWKNVNVTILKNLVPLMLRRIEKGHENFNSKADPA
ncbi:hypothetical protein JHK87_011897 [Glycine soja]|nr:hypothetical protein JHK87_011897 [Glycine soja]